MKMKYVMIFIIGIYPFFSGCENPLSQNPVIGIIKNLSGSIKYYPGGSEEFVTLRTADINNRPLFSMDMLKLDTNSFYIFIFTIMEMHFLVMRKLKPNSSSKSLQVTKNFKYLLI